MTRSRMASATGLKLSILSSFRFNFAGGNQTTEFSLLECGLAILAEEDSALPQLRNSDVRVVQHFLEYLCAMLAQKGSLDVRQIRVGREFQRKAGNCHFAEDRIAHLAHHVARLEVRMLHRVGNREHRRARDAVLLE